MPSLWTESRITYDTDDSEEPAVRARRVVENEAVRAASECARMPDIRVELVREMRGRIAAGLYQISAGDIADAIICSAMRSRPSP